MPDTTPPRPTPLPSFPHDPLTADASAPAAVDASDRQTEPGIVGPAKAAKEALRRAKLLERDALDAGWREAAAEAIAAKAGALPLPPGALIGGFLAIRSEVDPAGLLVALRRAGHPIALPVVLADRETMIFRHWHEEVGLVRASFGLSVPPEDADVVEPRHLLVPLAAFDRRGYRIGYGKGHYDRAIARLAVGGPVITIGVAFSAQEVDSVPDEVHDHPLDFILTERELITIKESG